MTSLLFKAVILGLRANPDHTSVLVKVTHAGDVDVEEIQQHQLVEPIIGTFRLAPTTLSELSETYADYGIQEIGKGSVVYFTAKGIREDVSGKTAWGADIHRFAGFQESSLSPASNARRRRKLMSLQTLGTVTEAAAIAVDGTVRL